LSVQNVTVLDATSNWQVKARISCPSYSAALTPDGQTLYVSGLTINQKVTAISTATNTVTATISGFSAPAGLAMTPNGKEVFVANAESGTVAVIDTKTNAIQGEPIAVQGRPLDVILARDGQTVDVVNVESVTLLQFITTASRKVSRPVGGLFFSPVSGAIPSPPRRMALSASGLALYGVNFANYVIAVKPLNGHFIRSISALANPLDSTWQLGQPILTPDDRYLYVPYTFDIENNSALHQVAMINVATGEITGPLITVGNEPTALAMAADGDTLYGSTPETALSRLLIQRPRHREGDSRSVEKL
jgi:YVTN family beta-propeller protein